MKTRKTKRGNTIRRVIAFLLCMTMVLGLGMQDVMEQVYAEEPVSTLTEESDTPAEESTETKEDSEAGEGTEPKKDSEQGETTETKEESVITEEPKKDTSSDTSTVPGGTTPVEEGSTDGNTTPATPNDNTTPAGTTETNTEASGSKSPAQTTPDGNTTSTVTGETTTEVTDPSETTEKSDPSEVTEPEEADENLIPEEETAKPYEAEQKVGNVTIHVSAEAGVLPEDAELSVTPIVKKEITEDMSEEEKAEAEEINAQYDETEQKLTEQLQEEAAEETEALAAENVSAGVNAVSESADADAKAPVVEKTLKGFLSYDISFLGENGEEIEPEGEVQVSFEFAEAALPDETSENMEVAVKHFKEEKNADGGEEIVVEDLTEAETTNIETEGESGAAVTKVELVANSFSEYTIVWYESIHDRYYKDSVEICYINTDGDEIVASLSDEDLKQYGENSPIDLENSEYNVDIEGYHYLKAVLAWNPNSALQSQTVIRSLRLYNKGNFRDNWSIQYQQGEYGNWSDIEYGQKIYIIYEPDPDTPGGGAVGDLAHRKYVTANGDGTYDLTLDVTGAMGTETNPASVDVVLVLDLSSSMNENHNLTNAKQAIYKLISDLESVSTVESRWKLVTFGNDATPANGWKSSTEISQDVRDAEVPWSFNGVGTNYQAGLEAAGDAIRSSSADNRIVVFLTDGQPTFHGDGVQGGGDRTNKDDYDGAIEGAGTITCDRFYAVGMNLTEDWVGSVEKTGEEVLQDVANAVHTQQRYVTNVKNIESDLENVFAGIAGEIIRYDAKNVTIIDKLTDEVDPIENAQPVIKVTNADGQDVTSQEIEAGKITASYTPGTKELTLQVGEPTYALKQDYTYSVTLQIQPNESAEKLYVDSGYRYPHRGEADTGQTSEGKGGIFTNVENSAKVTWTTDEQQKEGTYNRPVVQIPDEELPVRPPETEQELSKEKYVKDNQDGTYDLTLNVSGQVGSLKEKMKVDIVLAFDLSGSMAKKANDRGDTNLQKAKDAVSALTSALDNKESVDAQWQLVAFSNRLRKATEGSTDGWVTAAQLNEKVQGFKDSGEGYFDQWPIETGDCAGGTNYEAALEEAGRIVREDTRNDAQKIVIFLTDGQPTYHDNNTEGGFTVTNWDDYYGALDGAELVQCDQFYAIGMNLPPNIGLKQEGYWGEQIGPDISGLELLQEIVGKVSASNKYAQNVDANDDLSNVFKGIAGSITSFLCSDVTIIDTLSQWAEIADLDADDGLTIQVVENAGTEEERIIKSASGKVKNGVSLTLDPTETNKGNENERTLHASYNSTTKQLLLDFPDDYQLEADYTYYVTVKIAPTIEAYERYQELGNNYPNGMIGDEGTDAKDNHTSSKQPGFYSNNEATVTYTYNGTEESREYFKPVIQVDEMTTEDTPFITVSKTFTGLTKDQIDELKSNYEDLDPNNDFVITVTDSGDPSKTKTLKLNDNDVLISEDGFTYTWKLEGFEPGQYIVTENGAEINNYELTTTGISENGNAITVDDTGWIFIPSVGTADVDAPHGVDFEADHDNSVLMIALRNPGTYLVWTKDSLSISQQNTVKEAINGFKDSSNQAEKEFFTGTVTDIHFYSGIKTLTSGVNYGGSRVSYLNSKLQFNPNRQWMHALTGTYTMSSSETDAVGDISVTNTYKLNQIFIDFQKYGTDYKTAQLEAKFKLEKMRISEDGNSINGVEEGSEKTATVSNAKNEFGGLAAGVYRLTETEAPEGYSVLDEPIYFRINGDGVQLLKVKNGLIIEAVSEQDMFKLEVASDGQNPEYTIKIKNNTLYDLPQAGGPGIYLYMLGGVALMMAGTLLVYKKRKEEVLRS